MVDVENAPQGLGGNNVFPVADQGQDALDVGRLLRAFDVKRFRKPLVPLLNGRNKNDVAFPFIIATPSVTPHPRQERRRVAPVAGIEPHTVHQRFAFAHAHGRIHNMKNQLIFFIISKNIISKNGKTFLLIAPGNFSRKMCASPNGLLQPGANTLRNR